MLTACKTFTSGISNNSMLVDSSMFHKHSRSMDAFRKEQVLIPEE